MAYSNSPGYSSCSSCGYHGNGSNLERIVYKTAPNSSYDSGNTSYMIAEKPAASGSIMYHEDKSFNPYTNTYHAKTKLSRTIIYHPAVDSFLAPSRPSTSFIGHANQIKEFIESAFYYTTGKQFPRDIIVHILPDREFEKAHKNSKLDFSIQGFAVNRKPFGFSEVFVRQDCVDRVMVTLGHELGHVMAKKLGNSRDEEAKAFAFCIAWLRKIKEHNIANLSTCIKLGKPAENGLHNRALEFVFEQINKGFEPLEIFEGLTEGLMRVDEHEF
jgi:hypothetical protein